MEGRGMECDVAVIGAAMKAVGSGSWPGSTPSGRTSNSVRRFRVGAAAAAGDLLRERERVWERCLRDFSLSLSLSRSLLLSLLLSLSRSLSLSLSLSLFIYLKRL